LPRLYRSPLPGILLAVLLAEVAGGQQAVTVPRTARPNPLTDEERRALSAVKMYAQDYIQRLPDYMCVQTTRRDFQPAALNSWPTGDEIRELVTFSAHRESYEVLSVNGKKVHLDHAALGGNISSGEFGTMLERIFDPASETDLGFARRAALRGVPVDVFTYRVSKEHGYTLHSGPPAREYMSAWEGLIYASRATGAVLRVRMECTGIPAGFPVHNMRLTLDYGQARIGDREYTLPSRFEMDQQTDRGVTKNRADFKNYRKFETDGRLTTVDP
jgi:hypothetical protein